MADYEIDKLLKDFEKSALDEKPDFAMDTETPLSEKLSESEIENAVAKKKKAKKDAELKEKIAAIRKKIADESRPSKDESEEDEEDLRRAKLIARLRRILQMQGAERTAALDALGDDFSNEDIAQFAQDYVRAAEDEDEPQSFERNEPDKDESPLEIAAPYAGGGGATYAGAVSGPDDTGLYASDSSSGAIDMSAEKTLEKDYHVTDNREHKELFSAKKQLESTYGPSSTSEESGTYCSGCDKKDCYKE